MRLAVAAFAVFAALLTAAVVYLGFYGFGAFIIYLAAVLCTCLAVSDGTISLRLCLPARRTWRAVLPIAALIAFQFALALYAGTFLNHFHFDEFVSAYASYQLPDITQIQWFIGYPPPTDWVTSFPSLFFVLQKPFLMLLGPTVEAVRISVWPYLAFSLVYLYLFAREFSPRPAFAAAAALCAIAFAPSLYIDTMGVMFHGSTLFLLASAYHVVRLVRTERRIQAILTGLFCALAYLTYTASYITLPVLLVFITYECLVQRSTRPFRLCLPALAVYLVVMLPFVEYALLKSNYFVERVGQINLLNGSSVIDPALSQQGRELSVIWDQVVPNLKLLVEPGGGAGRYAFGRLAFFDTAGLALFALGLLYGVLRVLRGEARAFVLVVVALGAAFVFGLVLTVPVGGFHHVTLILPFVGLVIALGLLCLFEVTQALLRRPTLARPVGTTLAALALVAFSLLNLAKANDMLLSDSSSDSLYIYRYFEENVPPSVPIAIAYAPSYHLGRELFFRTGGRRFVSGYPADILAGPSLSVIILAYQDAQTIEAVRSRYPEAVFIDRVDGVWLQDHFIVITGGIDNGPPPQVGAKRPGVQLTAD
jgi:hypothetical protein